jgi:cobalt-zinc-cadmium efflux system membrane fusion protein
MNRPIARCCLLVSLALCCNRTDGEESHSDEKGGGHAREAEAGEGEHENEAHLTSEAAERAGIRVAIAERRALTGGVAIPAEVEFEPSSTAHVVPLAPGRITRVAVALGDRVRRGQELGVVASTDVSTARAKLDQARARLSAAESAERRQQQLSTEGIGARRQLIEAEAQVSELRAEVEGLRRQLSVFGSGRAGELALTSPIDGMVVSLHGTLGETASTDTPMFIVTDPTKVWVRGNVPELEISRVQSGSAAVVRLHAFPDLAMAGTITYVAPALEEQTRSLPVRVSLQSPDARLRSGLFGSIELVGGSVDERVLVVPVDAVATLEGQTVVFVPADEPNSFRPQPIALGRRAGGFIEVRSGLDEGARLAISGAFTLKSTLRSGELSEGHEH